MVYVKSDGTVCQNPPIHERLFRLIFGMFSFVIFFFKSLLGMDTSNSKRNGGSKGGGSFFGGSSGGGGGGGGGGRPFGPGGPGGGPNIRTMRDINPPTVSGGGCPGGGCGM